MRSAGSSIIAKPGSLLAEFISDLGNKIGLLDAIPPSPITFEKQTDFPSYAPFRMRLGSYLGCPAYVYRAKDKKSTLRVIVNRADGQQRDWTFLDLSNLELVPPFSLLFQKQGQEESTRNLKTRYLVYYYLMLAENEGLISNAGLRTSLASFKPSFCAACRDLQAVIQSAGNIGLPLEQSTSEGAVIESQSSAASVRTSCETETDPELAPMSLVVKLPIDPRTLEAIIGVTVGDSSMDRAGSEASQPAEVADSEDEDLGESSVSDDGSDRQTEMQVDVGVRLSQTPSEDPANTQLHLEEASAREDDSMETDKEGYTRYGSRDSGFASSSAPLLSPKTPTSIPSRQGSMVDSTSVNITDDTIEGHQDMEDAPESLIELVADSPVVGSISGSITDATNERGEDMESDTPALLPGLVAYPPAAGSMSGSIADRSNGGDRDMEEDTSDSLPGLVADSSSVDVREARPRSPSIISIGSSIARAPEDKEGLGSATAPQPKASAKSRQSIIVDLGSDSEN